MTRRHTSRRAARYPKVLAASLPDELRSFDGWEYPHGISDYMRGLSRFLVEPTPLQPVMSAAGLSVAGWFRGHAVAELHHAAAAGTWACGTGSNDGLGDR